MRPTWKLDDARASRDPESKEYTWDFRLSGGYWGWSVLVQHPDSPDQDGRRPRCPQSHTDLFLLWSPARGRVSGAGWDGRRKRPRDGLCDTGGYTVEAPELYLGTPPSTPLSYPLYRESRSLRLEEKDPESQT